MPRLQTLVVGGEPLLESDFKWAIGSKLINVFGVSECGIVTIHRVLPGVSDATNIGRGVGCITWILDPDDDETLMRVGTVGELVVEGPIVARGYLNLPDRTASSFIDPPAWRKDFPLSFPPGRFYKTGDLCRYGADGSINCVGRKDSQVQIGGQRVGLDEVEHHIRKAFFQARQVSAAFLPPDANSPANLEGLVVFIDSFNKGVDSIPVVPESDLAMPTDSFCQLVRKASKELRETLPNYMIPSIFLPLFEVPRMDSGKADVQRLIQQAKSLSTDQIVRYSAHSLETKQDPETATELQLQQIWAEVLRLSLDQIGANSDFFSLGGRSLDAMRMVTLARRAELRGLTVAAIFKYPTLSPLATAIDEGKYQEPTPPSLPLESDYQVSSLPPSVLDSIEPDQVLSILPTTDFQRIWLVPGVKNYDFWKITQPVDMHRFRQALQAVVDRHSILRTIFVPHQGRFLQVVLSHLAVRFNLCTLDGFDHDSHCHDICQADMDDIIPPGGQYFWHTLVSSEDGNCTLILRTSHAQWDSASWELIIRDFVKAYHGEDLPPITTGFSMYMQHRLAQATDAAWEFWRRYLRGASMTKSVGLVTSETTRHLVGVMSVVPHPPPVPGLTVATLVKAGWALTLARVTQTLDLVFGHTVNGRSIDGLELEEVVGCCVNTVPIRVTIQPDWTPLQLLEHVQSQYTQTIAYELLEPSEIIRNCTPWPADTAFGSVVTHDHSDTQQVMALDGGLSELRSVYPAMRQDSRRDMVWPIQFVTRSEQSQLHVGIMGFDDVMSNTRAQWLCDRFGEALTELTDHTAHSLSLAPYTDT